MSKSSSNADIVVFLLVWILLLSAFNQDDDVARYLGRFAADVVTGFNGV